jgi:hypothetical protein
MLAIGVFQNALIQAKLANAETQRKHQRRLKRFLYELFRSVKDDVKSGAKSRQMATYIHLLAIEHSLQKLEPVFAELEEIRDREYADQLIEFVRLKRSELGDAIGNETHSFVKIVNSFKRCQARHSELAEEQATIQDFLEHPEPNVDDSALIEPTSTGAIGIASLFSTVSLFFRKIAWKTAVKQRERYLAYQREIPRKQAELEIIRKEIEDINAETSHLASMLLDYEASHHGVLAAAEVCIDHVNNNADPLYTRVIGLIHQYATE